MNAEQRAFRRQIVAAMASDVVGMLERIDWAKLWDYATALVLAEPNDATDYAERLCQCGERVAVRQFVTDPEHQCSMGALLPVDDFKRGI